MCVFADATHALRAQQPAPATQQAGDDLAELSLLNRLIELGGKAAGAHATSNSDDGPKGTAAYVQWQELRSEMGELIRRFYTAAPQPSPTAQAAESVPAGPKRKDMLWSTAKMQERHDQRIENIVSGLERIKQEHAGQQPQKIDECYGDCPTDSTTCTNPCRFDGRAARATADSVLEDAARYQWLRRWKGQEHEPPFTVQHEIDGTLWGGDLDAAIDAAMNKGGAA